MFDLPLTAAVVVFFGAFVAAFAAGIAGFAFAVVASAFWLHVLEPARVAAMVVGCGLLLQIGLTWRIRRSIAWPQLLPFVIAAIAGIPLGIWLLAHVNLKLIKVGLGTFLLLFGLYALAAPKLPQIQSGGRIADAAIGFVGGILGGVGGYSGVLPTIWTQLRGWPKEFARSVYQPFILIVHALTLALTGGHLLDRAGIEVLLIALPALLAGAGVGWVLYGRLEEGRFRRVLGALVAASGASLIV